MDPVGSRFGLDGLISVEAICHGWSSGREESMVWMEKKEEEKE